jgi:RNA polymerase sigma-70 factor (ECF subfamily)
MGPSSSAVKSGLTGENNRLSLEHLFNFYYARLCYFAFKMIGEREAAEDLVQEAFVKLWERQEDFTNELSAKTFLYVTTRNACLNRIRHEEVEKKYIKSHYSEEVEAEKGLQSIIQAEVLGEIHNAIEELPQGCRQVLKLAYFEGLKNHEIAEQLGVSVNTIKTQKARALQLLRLKLDVGAITLLTITLAQH